MILVEILHVPLLDLHLLNFSSALSVVMTYQWFILEQPLNIRKNKQKELCANKLG